MVLNEMEGDKTLGPDGFTMEFFQSAGGWWNGMFWHCLLTSTDSVFLINHLMPLSLQ